MTFRQTLSKHLRAIQGRDLEALIDTISPDQLTMIMSDGVVVRSPSEFARLHASWFESTSWTLDISQVAIIESSALGVATLLLEYRDEPEDRPPVDQKSILTLIFANQDGVWVLIHDQNTPVKPKPEAEEDDVI
ncbi:nuclear transport factor 2 family protein [Paludisphaera sp.]|uniref:YybH family protein n=1 Tax=Paludisphaera sp. TaxID=2017432 RepID=UPI00301CB1FC